MATIIEYLEVRGTKEQIDFDLSGYSVSVVGSCFTEEGYGLVIEGSRCEVEALALEWEEAGVLVA